MISHPSRPGCNSYLHRRNDGACAHRSPPWPGAASLLFTTDREEHRDDDPATRERRFPSGLDSTRKGSRQGADEGLTGHETQAALAHDDMHTDRGAVRSEVERTHLARKPAFCAHRSSRHDRRERPGREAQAPGGDPRASTLGREHPLRGKDRAGECRCRCCPMTDSLSSCAAVHRSSW